MPYSSIKRSRRSVGARKTVAIVLSSDEEQIVEGNRSSNSPSNENIEFKKNNAKHNKNKLPKLASNKNLNESCESSSNCDTSKTEKQVKEMRTVSNIFSAMTPTSEELEYRMKLNRELDKEEKYSKMFKCTKCSFNFNNLINEKKKINVHPLLGILMCQKCCNYYGDGDFSLDSDNEDKYCRWCGDGGTIFACSKCICGFCSSCIKVHFGKNELKKIQEGDNWLCYICNTKPLWTLRYICSLAIEKSQNKNKKIKNMTLTCTSSSDDEEHNQDKNLKDLSNKHSSSLSNTKIQNKEDNDELQVTFSSTPKIKLFKKKRKESSSGEYKTKETKKPKLIKHKKHLRKKKISYTESSSESSDEFDSPELKRPKISTPLKQLDKISTNEEAGSTFESTNNFTLNKLLNILKLMEYQMSMGMNWSIRKLKQLKNTNDLTSEELLREECQKVKWFISSMASTLVGFSSSVDIMEKSLSDKIEPVEKESVSENSSFWTILKFLDFVKNQIKTFDSKGIQLKDLLEFEILDDIKVLGLKKNNSISDSHSPKPSQTIEDGDSVVSQNNLVIDESANEDQLTPVKIQLNKNFNDNEHDAKSPNELQKENNRPLKFIGASPETLLRRLENGETLNHVESEEKSLKNDLPAESNSSELESKKQVSPMTKNSLGEELKNSSSQGDSDTCKSFNDEDVQAIVTILKTA